MSGSVDGFYRVVAELDRLLIPGVGDGFWSARPLFDEMDRTFLGGWAQCRLKEISDEKDLLAFRDRNALTINITKGYAISLAMIEASADDLYLYPQHYMARNVGPDPITVRRYRPDRIIDPEIYDPNIRLELGETFELQPGETIDRNGHTDVLDWEPSGKTGFVLRLHSESLGNYEWTFDRKTLAPKGVTVLDSFSSQLATAMQMLTALGVPVDQGFVEMGLQSRYFHVRWETLRMISQTAPEQTQQALERLKNDPHPAIRRAIEKTVLMNSANKAD